MTLLSVEQMRQIIGDTGDVTVISNEALSIIIDSSQAEVDTVSGGPNSIGVQYTMEAVSVDVEKIGNMLGIAYGNRGALHLIEYQDTVDDLVAVLDIHSNSAMFISDLNSQHRSTYITFNRNVYEFIYTDIIMMVPTKVRYGYVADSAAGIAIQAGLSELVDGSVASVVIAGPGAYVPMEARGLIGVKKQAIVELTKLKMNYDALTSIRDGSYSRVSADYSRERTRILRIVSNKLATSL